MVLHEEGFVVNCCLCDSYFVLTTSLCAPAAYRGKAGREKLDDRNEKLQRQFAAKRWALLRCSACIELSSGTPFLDWMEQHARDQAVLTPFSPCFFVTFEEGELPPLYLDHKPAGEAGKPKWRLASGVGPAGLEMDSSKSGRLWKPSLKAVGIDAPRYTAAETTGGQHAEMVAQVEAAFAFMGERASTLADALHACRPAFAPRNWTAVATQVESAVVESAAADRAAVKAERQGWSEKRRRHEELETLQIVELS